MNQQSQSYPVDQLTQQSSQDDQEQALAATIQQLIQEGVPQDQAQSQAMQMLQVALQTPAQQMSQRTSSNMGASMMNPNSQFARGGGGNVSGASKGQSVPNVRLTNFNPIRQGGYERVN